MSLAESVLALLTSNAPPEARGVEADRLRPVAEAIAAEAAASPVLGTERETAAALVAIGFHESGFRETVRTCAERGDNGQSVGLFQVKGTWGRGGHSVQEVCSSDSLQARLALRVLRIHRERGVRGAALLFRAYAAGSAAKDTQASRDLAASYRKLQARMLSL